MIARGVVGSWEASYRQVETDNHVFGFVSLPSQVSPFLVENSRGLAHTFVSTMIAPVCVSTRWSMFAFVFPCWFMRLMSLMMVYVSLSRV